MDHSRESTYDTVKQLHRHIKSTSRVKNLSLLQNRKPVGASLPEIQTMTVQSDTTDHSSMGGTYHYNRTGGAERAQYR